MTKRTIMRTSNYLWAALATAALSLAACGGDENENELQPKEKTAKVELFDGDTRRDKGDRHPADQRGENQQGGRGHIRPQHRSHKHHCGAHP